MGGRAGWLDRRSVGRSAFWRRVRPNCRLENWTRWPRVCCYCRCSGIYSVNIRASRLFQTKNFSWMLQVYKEGSI